jgi:Mor family transcriptional regulator
MKYVKASDILPAHLIAEIQRYAEGHLIYIPNKTGTRKAWGQSNGAKYERMERNNKIRDAYKDGRSICHIAEEFCLSVETIKKIIYSR